MRTLLRSSAALALVFVSVPATPQQERTRLPDLEMFPVAALSEDQQAATVVIGARRVDPKLYPASFYSRHAGGGVCTSTLVGPKALLTAAHCVPNGGIAEITVSDGIRRATCSHAPEYDRVRNPTADYALCLVEPAVTDIRFFETVNTDGGRVAKGSTVLLTGFGCVSASGRSDGIYRVGEATVERGPTARANDFLARGRAAVCYGDSGGPAFVQAAEDGSSRVQVSVNSRGDLGERSSLASLTTPTAQRFLTGWATAHNAVICGVHEGATKCGPQSQ